MAVCYSSPNGLRRNILYSPKMTTVIFPIPDALLEFCHFPIKRRRVCPVRLNLMTCCDLFDQQNTA